MSKKTQAEKWIQFKEIESPSPKTKRWAVWNTRTGECCGEIRWWGAWWKYVFFPTQGFLFDTDCLRMIADFMEENKRARKSFLPKGTGFSGFGMPDDGQNYSV